MNAMLINLLKFVFVMLTKTIKGITSKKVNGRVKRIEVKNVNKFAFNV